MEVEQGQLTTTETQSSQGANTENDLGKRLQATALEAKQYRQQNAEFRQQNGELKKQLEDLQRKQIEQSGDLKAMYEAERKARAEIEDKLGRTKQAFASQLVTKQLAFEATKLGAVDVDAVIALSDLSQVEIDDEFNVSTESTARILGQLKEKKPYLFKPTEVKIINGVPARPQELKQKSLGEMSKEELLKLAHQMAKK